MELTQALRLKQGKKAPRVAFVGAGGKTTAMFQCANHFPGAVLVTATTHLLMDQLLLADQHYFGDHATLDQLEKDMPTGVTLLTGPVGRDSKRVMGVSDDLMARIYELAEERHMPLLIEADGSRQLPIKAPADHEPAIPEFVDLVVVAAGLSVLGKPLNSKWVHRPEIFAALSGLSSGEIITSAALAEVMRHPEGGLKNIPGGAREMALLNQADTAELQAQASQVCPTLLERYSSVIISSLIQTGPRPNPQRLVHAVHEPIGAVILAAGASRRLGRPKQLLDWHGKPLIWHVAQKALRAGLNDVVVVCGNEMAAIQAALADLPVRMIHNRDWQQGQGTSVKLGAQAASSGNGGLLFLLADQPQIPVLLVRSLVNYHAQNLSAITGPMIDGKRGNPVLFDQVTFDDLTALSGEAGGRKLFAKYAVDWIPWHDPDPFLDVDTPDDYLRLLEMDR